MGVFGFAGIASVLLAAGQGPVTATKASLAGNAQKRTNGDVLIPNVPMVDQGEEGYCVVSAMERVFRYYGRTVDRHEMARLADTRASGGTSISGMMEALNQIAGNFNVRVRVHEKFDFREFERTLDSYNRDASRIESIPEVHLPKSGIIDIATIYSQVEPKTFRTARMKRPGRKSFHRQVRKNIEDGIPLLWAVLLGMYPEEKLNPQSKGGHMRLIIGFNDARDEYLYSDTWGAGHEVKRMSTADAYAMTTGMFTIEPRR